MRAEDPADGAEAGPSTPAARPVLTPGLPLSLRSRHLVVTVVGDLMLDGWWSGRSERMTREAPAPVVEVTDRHYAPGGAGNTAMNLAALGAAVRLVGLVGDDPAGRLLRDLLVAGGVDVRGLLLSRQVTTVTKNRILSGDQILLRLDELHETGYPEPLSRRLAEAAVAATAGTDALLVCDYGSGLLHGAVRDALQTAPRAPLVVVDAHEPRRWQALAPDVATPNAGEAFRMLGAPARGDRAELLAAAADRLRQLSGARELVVTLDRDGTLVLNADAATSRTHGRPASERQAAGAGDTFVAALTLARAAGLSLDHAAQLAQTAADVVVQRFGTAVCSTDDLVAELGRRTAPLPRRFAVEPEVVDQETLLREVARQRAAGRRIVLTNGCFDVLHRGHVTYLAQAAQLGDVLVVAVNSDESVRRLKGPDRPVNTTADRARVLAALSCVDLVTVFDSDTPIPLLERLRPDVYTKGGDYTPDMLAETEVVRRYGGEVRIMGYVSAQSSTAVLDRIRAVEPN